MHSTQENWSKRGFPSFPVSSCRSHNISIAQFCNKYRLNRSLFQLETIRVTTHWELPSYHDCCLKKHGPLTSKIQNYEITWGSFKSVATIRKSIHSKQRQVKVGILKQLSCASLKRTHSFFKYFSSINTNVKFWPQVLKQRRFTLLIFLRKVEASSNKNPGACLFGKVCLGQEANKVFKAFIFRHREKN